MKKIKNYQEFTNEEINWKKGVATAALGASLLGGIQSCGPTEQEIKQKEKQEQLTKFINQRDIIQSITPEDMIIQLNKNIETIPSLNQLYSNSPESYNSQIATFYQSESNDLVDFILDIMIYKGIIKDKNISVEEFQEFVNRVRNNKTDEFDELIVNAFDKLVENQQRFLEYDRQSGYLRKSSF
jgi:hypothetical protein